MDSSLPIRRRSRYVPPEETKKKGAGGVVWGVAIALLAIAGLGMAWAFGLFGRRTDARIVEIQTMSAEIQKQMANGGPQNEVEAREFVQSMGQVREKIMALPEELRGEAFRGGGMGRGFMAAQQANMKAFFATPPEKRKEELDKQIKREQMLMKAFASAGGFGRGGGGPPGGGPPGGGAGGGGPPGGGAAGGAGGRWGGGNFNAEAARKQMLDGTSPSQRAQFTEYRNAMDQRRQELGISGGGWGGPPGGRGG